MKNLERPANVGLRLATLGTRFLFIFFLARFLDAGAVGYYGIFTATVGYALYLVGLDYYVFVTREIVATGRAQQGRLLKGQAMLAGLLYAGLLPVAVLALAQAHWPAHLALWFLPILVLEHFNQEIFRLLVAISEQIAASIILFIRQGSWAVAIIVLMALRPDSRNLDAVMAAWLLAGVVAAGVGAWKIHRLQLGGWRLPVDWRWIRQGVAVSGAFLLATLALRAIQTVDRYWLQALAGIDLVGAYVLFTGVAAALLVFLDAGVFSFGYPALIRHAQRHERAQARARLRRMLIETVLACALFAGISWALLPLLLRWVGNPVYAANLWLYPWVLAAMILNAIGLVPHYALYALGHDRRIIAAHLAALPLFALTTWAVALRAPLVAVPAGVCAAFAGILLWKTLALWRARAAAA